MKTTVLIVEDEIVLQDVYKLILESNGYEVHTASNGVEAFKKLQHVKPAVILLDIFMPVMDGKEFLRNLDTKEFTDTQIIVYSNLSDRSTEQEMLELGANDFILKSSLTPDALVDVIRQRTS